MRINEIIEQLQKFDHVICVLNERERAVNEENKQNQRLEHYYADELTEIFNQTITSIRDIKEDVLSRRSLLIEEADEILDSVGLEIMYDNDTSEYTFLLKY